MKLVKPTFTFLSILSLTFFWSYQGLAQGNTCATAVAVAVGMHTADGPNAGGGATDLCDASAGLNADWYSFTPANQGVYRIESCNDPGDADTQLSVFGGSCGALFCIGQNDDACPTFLTSLDLCLEAGTTYYLQWDDQWDNSGFDWEISFIGPVVCPAAPVNDLCTNAISLSAPIGAMCASQTLGTNAGALSSPLGTPAPSCGSPGGDVWYQFNSPSSGHSIIEITEEMGGPGDWVMAAYTGGCGGLMEIGCNDDSGPGLLPKIELNNIPPGTIIYVRVWEFNDNRGPFNICVYGLPMVPTLSQWGIVILALTMLCILVIAYRERITNQLTGLTSRIDQNN